MTIRAMTAPLALLALVAGACGGLTSGAGPDGGIQHPTGAAELVLRVEVGGGFVPAEVAVAQIPPFSLFGDGRVITEGPRIQIFPRPALPNLLVTRVSEEGVQRILEEARDAGLLGPDRHYDYPFVADAPTTTFTVVAEGTRHVVSAYALGFELTGGPPPDEESRDPRSALAEFEARVLNLRSWLPEGSVGEEEFFAFDELRIYARPWTARDQPAELEPTVKEWPLAQSLAEFGRPVDFPPDTRCGSVQGKELETLLPTLQESNELTLWRSEGATYRLVLRPLLPDESGC